MLLHHDIGVPLLLEKRNSDRCLLRPGDVGQKDNVTALMQRLHSELPDNPLGGIAHLGPRRDASNACSALVALETQSDCTSTETVQNACLLPGMLQESSTSLSLRQTSDESEPVPIALHTCARLEREVPSHLEMHCAGSKHGAHEQGLQAEGVGCMAPARSEQGDGTSWSHTHTYTQNSSRK